MVNHTRYEHSFVNYELLISYLNKNSLSYRKLGTMIQEPASTIQQGIQRQDLRVSILEKICKAIGRPVGEFFEPEKKMEEPEVDRRQRLIQVKMKVHKINELAIELENELIKIA